MSSNFKVDMKKLEKSIKKQAVSSLNKRTYDVICPHCKSKVNIPTGKSMCPICRKEIDLTLDVKF